MLVAVAAAIAVRASAAQRQEVANPTNSPKPQSPAKPSTPAAEPSSAIELVDPSQANPLDPSFFELAQKWSKYVDKKPIQRLPSKVALPMADRIRRAWSKTNDDEKAIFRVFRMLKTQADVARMAEEYPWPKGSTSLKAILAQRMSSDERATIQKIIQQKPIYQHK